MKSPGRRRYINMWKKRKAVVADFRYTSLYAGYSHNRGHCAHVISRYILYAQNAPGLKSKARVSTIVRAFCTSIPTYTCISVSIYVCGYLLPIP